MSNFNLIKAEVPQRKVFFLDGNGRLDKKSYQFPKYYTQQSVVARDLREMYSKFQSILKVGNAEYYSVIRGDWKSDGDLYFADEMRILRMSEATSAGELPKKSDIDPYLKVREKDSKVERMRRGVLIDDTPRHWVCFDFDGLLIDGLGDFDVSNPHQWVRAAITSELGPEFTICDHLIHLSASAGVGGGLRAHVWFWLDEPMDGAAWRAWFARRTEILGRRPAIDKSLFEKEKVHFIAPPSFTGSAVDPCAETGRLFYVEEFEPSVVLEGIEDFLGAARAASELRAAKGVDYVGESEREEAQDAWGQKGIVGAFNRVFSMSETIEKFLSDHYRIDTVDGRVTWLKSESGAPEGNRIVAGNTKMFSSHSSCPFEGEPRSAFELVCYWNFSDDFGAMARWAENILEVRSEKDRVELDVFDDYEPSEHFVKDVKIVISSENSKKTGPLTPDDLMREYPMPDKWGGMDASYRINRDGDWFYGYEKPEENEDDDLDLGDDKKKKKGKKKSGGKGGFVELWSPITIVAEEICAVTGDQITRFKMRGAENRAIDVLVPRQDLEPNKLGPALKRKGWRVAPVKHVDFCNFVNVRGLRYGVYVMPKRGWNAPPVGVDCNTLGFATLGGEVLGSDQWPTSYPCILKPTKTLKPNLAKTGTLAGWKNGISQILGINNVHHWVLGAVVGFAGPLVELLDCPTSGFAICGNTSRGKTTMMCIAASAWGVPGERAGGLFKTLNSTENAVESIAVDANGTVLILDETNTAKGESLEPLIYKLSTGIGKLRLDVNSESREASRWSTFGLISGELGVSEKFEQATNGKKMGKGAALRFLDMDISGFNESVDLNLIRHFRSIIDQNYGVAGPEFVRNLIEEGHHLDPTSLVKMRNQLAAKICGESVGGIHGRGAEVLSLIWLAASLADKWSIIPEGALAAVESAIEEMWRQFIGGAVANNDERLLEDIRLWVASRFNNTIMPVGSSERSSGAREGWYDENTVYLPTKFLMVAAGGTTRAKEISKLLADRGVLIPRMEGRYSHAVVPGAGRIAHFRLSRNGENGVLPVSDTEKTTVEF